MKTNEIFKNAKEVTIITEDIANLRTVCFEPMNDSIYGVFNNLAEAKEKYTIVGGYDWFGVCDDTLYIAFVD